MSELPRRRLLAVTGTALTGAVAGCTGSDEDAGNGNGNGDGSGNGDGNETENESGGPSGTLLGEISVENLDDAAHTVDTIVEFDDGPEHWSTHELAGNDGIDLERNWSTDPGTFRVMFRLDGGSPTQVTPKRWNDPDCVNVFALVEGDGELTIGGDTDGGPCGEGDAELDDAET